MGIQFLANRLVRRVVVLLLAVLAPCHALPAAEPEPTSERLAKIQQRGTLIVGVKTDYRPFGGLNSAGEPLGFEHDLAADIARRLGVELVKVPVSATTRLQKLQDDTIDLVIATTGDTSDRRKIVTMVEPDYYASGVTLLMPPQSRIKDWPDVRGQKVCAIQGAYYNRTMQERYLLDLKIYNNPRDAKLALRNGQCVGFLFDNTAIIGDLASTEWQGWQAPLRPALPTPWAIAMALDERGGAFDRLIGDIVADWHRSGFLIEREKAWGIPPSAHLAEQHALWRRDDADGKPFCHRIAAGAWNAECRNAVFLTSEDVGGFARVGLRLQEHTGIDLSLVFNPYDRSRFLRGLATTLLLTALCIAGSLAVGVAGAIVADSRNALLSPLVRSASAVARMTPPLLVIYLLLFGVGTVFGVPLAALAVVVICLSLYTGAAVMTALLDAAATWRAEHPGYRLRIGSVQRLAPLASGSVTASLINVSKATMMASAVAVPELLSAATAIAAERGNAGVTMTALLLTYFLIVFCVVRVLQRLERRVLARVADEPR
jgi:polar amino acid transport system substrate-binding protein